MNKLLQIGTIHLICAYFSKLQQWTNNAIGQLIRDLELFLNIFIHNINPHPKQTPQRVYNVKF